MKGSKGNQNEGRTKVWEGREGISFYLDPRMSGLEPARCWEVSSLPRKAQGDLSDGSRGWDGSVQLLGPAQVTVNPWPTHSLSAWLRCARDGGKVQGMTPVGLEKRNLSWLEWTQLRYMS